MRRARLVVMAGLVFAFAGMSLGAAHAVAACSEEAEALRAEARSVQLPECRAYELVSPVYTADGGVFQFLGVAPDGEAALFKSTGAFAGAGSDGGWDWYIARRAKNVGWETSWVGLPGSLEGEANGTTVSYDLTKDLVRLKLFLSNGKGEGDLFLSEDLAAAPLVSFSEVTGFKGIPPNNFGNREDLVDESPDFSHLVVESEPNEAANGHVLYELAGVGSPGEVLRLVNVDANGSVVMPAGVGGGKDLSHFHAVSNSGSEIFFTGKSVSYVRVNGSKTLELGGLFQGASEDGSKVFLSGAGELYMDEIGSKPGHKEVTKTVPISAGAFGFYLRSSDDGSHVYFLSTAVLASNENGNKENAEENKFNLYVYDTATKKTEKTAFIAQAVPGITGQGFEAQVNGCPSRELKEREEPGCEAGRFFVFSTTARLTAEETGGGQNVYEYDARSGRLTRVSTGEGGYDQNADSSAFHGSIAIPRYAPTSSENQTELFEDNTRAVSDDGSTVVFTSSQALSPRAVNHQPDIYEWHEGQVGLISTGHSLTPDEEPVITPSGRDILFESGEGIVPQDVDGLRSLYDARIGGGFPAAPVGAGGCSGDSCQGPPSVPSLLGASGSATFSGLGNPAPAVSKQVVKPRQCKKGYVRRKGRCVKKARAKKARNRRRAGR